MPSFQSFKIVYGSPIIPMVNKVMRILSEAGLIQLWSRNMIHDAIISGDLYPENYDVSENSKAFAMDSFGVIMKGMFIAYFFAFLVFLVELIWFYFSK